MDPYSRTRQCDLDRKERLGNAATSKSIVCRHLRLGASATPLGAGGNTQRRTLLRRHNLARDRVKLHSRHAHSRAAVYRHCHGAVGCSTQRGALRSGAEAAVGIADHRHTAAICLHRDRSSLGALEHLHMTTYSHIISSYVCECVAVHCSEVGLLQCIAICCSVLRYVAAFQGFAKCWRVGPLSI